MKPGKVLLQSCFSLRVNCAFIKFMASDKNVMFKLLDILDGLIQRGDLNEPITHHNVFAHVPDSRSSVRMLGSCRMLSTVD